MTIKELLDALSEDPKSTDQQKKWLADFRLDMKKGIKDWEENIKTQLTNGSLHLVVETLSGFIARQIISAGLGKGEELEKDASALILRIPEKAGCEVDEGVRLILGGVVAAKVLSFNLSR
ncbi:MAG: hypothetical protein NT041_02015 [Candidatus Vogelbacteria bacterium]|nr:hypothetical protein [Candidatus Vogelbacteria bacterium]